MRAWKNKKGVTAYLVFVVLTLGSGASSAKEPVQIQSGTRPDGGLIKQEQPLVEKDPSASKAFDPNALVKAEPLVAQRAPSEPNAATQGETFVPPREKGAPSFPPPPAMNPGKAPLPPNSLRPPPEMGEQAPPFMPPSGMPGKLPPPSMDNPFMPLDMDKATDQIEHDEGVEPPSMPPMMRGNSRRPPVNDQVNRRARGEGVRDNMPPWQNAAKNKPKATNTNEADIFHVVPQKCTPAKGQFIWNFEEEELIAILRQVSDLLCRTIIVNEIGKNLKMTIIGKSPLTPKDAWDVLMASLGAKGFTLVEQGKTWTVVKRSDSKSYATPLYANGKQARNNEEIGTLFYKAVHAPQEVLKNVARVLISKDGLVESVGDQFIIVIDSNSNIRRLGGIFAQVDIEDAMNKVHIISLHNADAKTVEKQLRDLFDITAGPQRTKKRRAGSPESRSALEVEKIIADERTNSLFVIGDSVDKLKEVIAMIDQPASDQGSKGKIHVKKLRFADAKKIAETLSAVVQQGKGGNRYGRRRDEPTNELFEGEVKITAHESSNTLVTVASANDYRALLATINKLDERKEQVYVEAVILDIEVKDKNEFGINLFSGLSANIPGLGSSLGLMANPGGKSIAEGIKTSVTSSATGANLSDLGTNSIGALAVLGNFLSGGVAGIVGPPAIPGSKIPSFGAVLQALSENANVDVLSTPYLLTTDNQQAEMSVGDKIPVIRGASSIGGGLGGGIGVPIQNVQHEDVKLTFKVTPHVGADDNVRLDIEQEVNELGAKMTILNQDQYSIRTKSAKTQLVLRDQQTGVIGGLMHHSSSKTDNKVPFLGDIPILGWLFKTRKENNERRSLLLIITPYIIRTEDDYRKILDRKFKEREEFARLYYGGKIKNYNPHIEYDKKAGPLSSLLLSVDQEMNKAENGGVGDGSEVIIKPKDSEPAKNENVPSVNVDTSDETVYLEKETFLEGAPNEFPFSDFSEPEGVVNSPNVDGVAP